MEIANITEMRQNPARVISRAVRTKQPVVVMQRSRPVAYIVDAASYEATQRRLDEAEKIVRLNESRMALEELANLRASMREDTGDSVALIRELRERRSQ
ncbi:MAG: type II toxin-antitoxin system Phd/YefM family antitoxin [Firmicutes bacterium]|nr:type II toxin-antitoxin system Phd/YefM family antitoxin [Bacillota bacterium]